MRRQKKKRQVRVNKEMRRRNSTKRGHGWAAKQAARRLNRRKQHWTNPLGRMYAK